MVLDSYSNMFLQIPVMLRANICRFMRHLETRKSYGILVYICIFFFKALLAMADEVNAYFLKIDKNLTLRWPRRRCEGNFLL